MKVPSKRLFCKAAPFNKNVDWARVGQIKSPLVIKKVSVLNQLYQNF